MAEPAAVPTLDEIQSQLESGAQPPSVDPFSDPPSGDAPGLVIEQPGQPNEETIRQEDLSSRVDELESELMIERKRRQDSAANYYKADNARQIAEGVVQSLQRIREEEARAMQNIANAQPPAPANVEELAEDPERLLEYIQSGLKWSVGTALAAMQPAWQQVQYGSARIENLSNLALQQSFDRARWEVEQMGFDDFQEAEHELKETFKAYGPDAYDMMLDPEKVVNGYLMLRRRKGLPMAKTSSSAPDVLPDAPSVRRSGSVDAKRLRELKPYADQVARMLDLDGGIKATEDDLHNVGLL